jgi:two-component system, OmpR family, response regulator MtrA
MTAGHGNGGGGMTTVLIADDDMAMRMLIGAAISDGDYIVVEAEDGDEAWDVIRKHRPRVALLDVQMGGQTGLEVTRRIRSSPDVCDIAVVLVSAKTQDTDVQAGYDAGADQYVTKPFSPNQLAQTVREWVLKKAS